MSYTPGPGSRVPVPRSRRRFERRRARRRRGFVAFLGALVLFTGLMAWANGRDESEDGVDAAPSPTGATAATGGTGETGGNGGNGNGDNGDGDGTIVPGETPIEHVVFIIKENRSFK